MKEVHPAPLSPAPLFNPDSEDEYPNPVDDIEMDDDDESATSGNVPLSLPSLLPLPSLNPQFIPPLEIRPLPQRAYNTQERRNDIGMDNDGTSHQESIMPAPQQNTAASAGTVVLFRHNPDSPIFNVGSKRPAQEEDEWDRRQKDERRKNHMRVNFANPAAPSPVKLREANQFLNRQIQVHQALLKDQGNTIEKAQQTILEFKQTTEVMAEDRRELLKIIEGLKADQAVVDAEMRRLKVQKEQELAAMHQKTRHANATATALSAHATHAAATAPAPALPASDAEMQFTDKHVATTTGNEGLPNVPSNSTTAEQSRHTAETSDQSSVRQPNPRRTNWGKLKEQAQKDRSKRREVLIATTTTYDSGSSEEDNGNEDASDNSEDNEITHISKKKLRDMVLAAAKTALLLSKRSTGKVQRGNEWKRKKQTALQKEKETDEGWERRIFCTYVRNLFETAFDVTHDDEFATHEPPSHEEILSFKKGDGEGPNPNELRIDMKGTIGSKWNNAVVDILLEKLLQKKVDPEYWGDMPERSEAYFVDLIIQKLTRARSSWRNAQPRLNEEGELESIDEVEKRMITTKEERDRAGRAYTRRISRYVRRGKILDKVIDIKESEDASDTPIWNWLRQLIKTLGEEGTSSDESEVDEQTGCTIYHVHKMPWRRNVDFEISMIDKMRFRDKDLFSNKGSKPLPRLRSDRNQDSSRKTPPKGLPKAVYNSEWVAKQSRQDKRMLEISREPFEWMTLRQTR